MLISTCSRLFRFLLLLVIRGLPRSFGRIGLALRARFASLWKSILTFAPRRGHSHIRLHANDVPVVDDNPTGERLQISERADAQEEVTGTLAVLPLRRNARWRDELPGYQALIPKCGINSHLLPATPEGASQRYKLREVNGQCPEALDIPAGQEALLSALSPPPDEWTRHVHPEGNVLFYHEGLRIFTESDINDDTNRTEILFNAATLIQNAIQTHDVTMDELTEIVLNVDDKRRWYYYFVDHKNRLLFWVHPVNSLDDLGIDLKEDIWLRRGTGMFLPVVFQYIIHDVESRSHCEFYPHNRTLPTGLFENLRGMLNYAKTDIMTADLSTSPFTQDELVAILDLVNSVNEDKSFTPYSVWVIARLMSLFTENQFMNFCGQPCARLNADTPLFGEQTWNRSTVFKFANVFLCFSLNEQTVRLQRVWVDGIIIQPRWKGFINRLTTELSRYTMFSTVMLAVNFSFLAVPGVVTVGSPASVIQIIIYCSVISTVGSIIFSFVFLNVYNDPGLMGASRAAEVMRTLGQKRWGMACLAIMHSLPIACLVWSIVLFSIALIIQIFLPKEVHTVVTLAVECGILVLLGVMSGTVMWLFSGDEGAEDVDASESAEDDPPAVPTDDVEKGPDPPGT